MVYINDDCFGIVKEYMGLYNGLNVDWDKLEKIGVTRLHDFYGLRCNKKIKYYKKDASKSRKMIYRDIFINHKSKEMLLALNRLANPIMDTYGLEIGDLACIGYNSYFSWGVLCKINKLSVGIRLFECIDNVTDEIILDKKKLLQTINTKEFTPINPELITYENDLIIRRV